MTRDPRPGRIIDAILETRRDDASGDPPSIPPAPAIPTSDDLAAALVLVCEAAERLADDEHERAREIAGEETVYGQTVADVRAGADAYRSAAATVRALALPPDASRVDDDDEDDAPA